MAHPDLLRELLRRPLPAQPGEAGASDVPAVAGTVQAGERQKVAQCEHLWITSPFHDRWLVNLCVRCGCTVKA